MEPKHVFAPPASFNGVRRLVLFFVVVVALVGLSYRDAHSRTVDVLSFTPPAGWETTQETGSMRMSHVDQAKDLSCQITVYTSRPSSGDLLADFFSEWTAIIGSPFPEAGELSEEKARIVGVARAVPVSGPSNYVRLITYSAGAKMASIELVTPTLAAYESYRPTIEAFLASVTVNSAASGTPPIDAGQQAQEGQQEQPQASRTDTSPTPQTERAEGSALPSSQDDPGSDPAVAGAQYAAPGASCRATLGCYASCAMTEDCLRTCDQRAGGDDVTLAHVSMSCIADSGCGADQDCVVQRCASELTACTEIAIAPSAPAGTPQTAVASASLDLVYSLPSGWTEQRGADWITLNYSVAGPSPTESYTLVILPSKPLSGTLTATFQALWAEMITPTFTPLQDPAIVPAPMRRRLASGFVAAFDGGLMKTNNGGMFTTMLYLISSGDRVVPILGMYGLLGDQSEPVLSAFFDSVSISGQTPARAPLFDASELVGKWSTQDTQDIAIRQDHTFNADGTYDAYAAWSQYGGLDRESSKGSWSIDDDSFVVETNGTSKRYRIFGIGTHRGVHSVFLPPSYDSRMIQFTRPRSVGDWHGKVK